jgi:hypothetical protein
VGIVREAKAIVPSAWTWANPKSSRRPNVLDIAYGTYRAPDTSPSAADGFLLRRVAPDSRKLDLKDVAKRELGITVLQAMRRDIGAIRAAHRRASAIVTDLAQRDANWLHVAAGKAQRAVETDHKPWLAEPGPVGEKDNS